MATRVVAVALSLEGGGPPAPCCSPAALCRPGRRHRLRGAWRARWLVNYQGGSAGRAARPFPSRGWRAPHSTSGRLRLCSHPGLPEAHGLTSTFGCVGRSTLGKDHSHLSRDPRPPTSPPRPLYLGTCYKCRISPTQDRESEAAFSPGPTGGRMHVRDGDELLRMADAGTFVAPGAVWGRDWQVQISQVANQRLTISALSSL